MCCFSIPGGLIQSSGLPEGSPGNKTATSLCAPYEQGNVGAGLTEGPPALLSLPGCGPTPGSSTLPGWSLPAPSDMQVQASKAALNAEVSCCG